MNKYSGKANSQFFFERLFNYSLEGMNFGQGADFRNSGEIFVLEHIKNKHKEDDIKVLFDVGANEGKYSETLAKIFNEHQIIYSFEPCLNTFNQLLINTSKINNIKLYNFGFSDSIDKKFLYVSKTSSGLASLYNRRINHHGIEMVSNEEIVLDTIDNFCTKNNIQKIHFLKLDIEGHELFALKGAQEMINKDRIFYIQFEFGGCNIDSKTYFQDYFYFLKDKYRIFRILKDGLIEICNYSEINEIFLTVNYLAVHRNISKNLGNILK